MTAPDKAFEEWWTSEEAAQCYCDSCPDHDNHRITWLASRKAALSEVRELLDASYEIIRLAHRTDLPDIADDGGSDMHGTYPAGAWTRFRNAVAMPTYQPPIRNIAHVSVALPEYMLVALTMPSRQALLDAIVRYGEDYRKAAG